MTEEITAGPKVTLTKPSGETKVLFNGTKEVMKAPKVSWSLRFLDRAQFMLGPLSSRVENLKTVGKGEFRFMRENFSDDQLDLMLKKGVFLYDWFTSISKLDEINLPPKKDFYSLLNREGISNEDYKHAKKVWDGFKMKITREYHDLCLKTDVLLLADVFEAFRDKMLEHYELDPCHYFTAPGMSWDAMLKMTGVELELINDQEKYDFIDTAKRSGVSTITHRYAKANNPYMRNIRGKTPKEIMNELRQRTNTERQFSVEMVCEYFPDFSAQEIKDLKRKMKEGKIFNLSEMIVYIQYLDANNLYGWAMSLPLPVGNFRWLNKTQLNLPINKLPPCFVEVDLSYPKELHDKFAEYVPAPDNITPKGSKVSKLAPNLLRKKKYVCHVKNLQLYARLGVVVEKVHRGLAFDESTFLAPYIEKNTQLRMQEKYSFEKDFFKLLNNSVFGKSCENLFNRVDVRLVSERKKALKLIARPTFKQYTIYDESLVGIHMRVSKVKLNKPSYIGVAVLDLSKTLIYDFHYNYIKSMYGEKAKLLFIDTDSLCYHIETEDFYKDIAKDVPRWFDTSDSPKDHPAGLPIRNKKVIGKMKDEVGGKIITEFAGVRAKCYAYRIDNPDKTCDCKGKCKGKCIGDKKCKGVKTGVVTTEITFNDYRGCVLKGTEKYITQNVFRSRAHNVFTENLKKKALCAKDDKRVILKDGIQTLPIGHWRTKHPDLHNINIDVKKISEKGCLINLAYNAI